MAAAVAAVTAFSSNPFDSDLARANSAYAAWRDGELVHPLERERQLSSRHASVHDEFRAHVLDAGFPCVGAKAAINNNSYRFGFYTEMNARGTTAGLARDLWTFAHEQPTFDSDYTTFVAVFAAPAIADEHQWEESLWAQLQSLHELDRRHHAWDSSVGSDPEDPGFSFSFAARSFFVVGLHPASSRDARRFAYPTLVFNPHEQFEQLRARNQFERMRQTIRARDYKLQGSINPNLSDHGELSEARQYSGRAVEQNWRCPFHAKPGATDDSQD